MVARRIQKKRASVHKALVEEAEVTDERDTTRFFERRRAHLSVWTQPKKGFFGQTYASVSIVAPEKMPLC